jgi:nitrile hydratase accessory protein
VSVSLDIDGPAAPPRANGELVFAEPWESRIFGVALSLHQAGRFEWPAFQAELIAAIARWEGGHDEGAPFRYYDCWLQALESLLDGLGLIDRESLEAQAVRQGARPVGHDH